METRTDFYNFVEEKMDIARENNGANCSGTLAYLVGSENKDSIYTREQSRNLLKGLVESSTPEKGYVVSWNADYDGKSTPLHMGLIMETGKYDLVVHRPGENKELHEYSRLDVIDKTVRNCFQSYDSIEMKFHVPSKLQKILNMENKQ